MLIIGYKHIQQMLTAVCITIISSAVIANDGAYHMSGNQLIPMTMSDIDVVKEQLNIKRIQSVEYLEDDHPMDKHDIDVAVKYELINTGKAKKVIVGFEAHAPSGDVEGCPVNGRHPYMQDFQVKVNGKKVPYKVAIVPIQYYKQVSEAPADFVDYFAHGDIEQLDFSDDCYNSQDGDYGMFVYYFDADFKQGNNTIEHHYRFESSSFVLSHYQFDYVLTAINRWGNGKVEDFEMTIDMGDMTSFNIHNSFFEDAKDWQLDGKIKAYPTTYVTDNRTDIPSTTFDVYNGYISFKKRNFTPKDELFIDAPRATRVSNGAFDAKVDNLPFNDLYVPTVDYKDKTHISSDFSKRVLRNLPFARRGYVFTDHALQEYYQRQPWYIADTSYKADYNTLSKDEQKHIQLYK